MSRDSDKSETRDGASPEEIVDEWMDGLEEKVSDSWPGSKKRPAAIVNDLPAFLMTYREPSGGDTRPWVHLRRCAMAAMAGFSFDDVLENRPLLNWMSHYQTPESFDKLLEEEFPEHDKYVVNWSITAKNNMKSEFRDYLQEEDSVVLMNPPDVVETFKQKYNTFEHFRSNNLPTLPTAKVSELYYDGEESVEDLLGSMDDGLVIKPCDGSGGKGVKSFDNLKELRMLLETDSGRQELKQGLGYSEDMGKDEMLDSTLLQPKLKHDQDLRAILVGDVFCNAIIRKSPPGKLCTNLSSIDSDVGGHYLGVYGKAMNAAAEGRVVPVDVGWHRQASDSEISERIGEDGILRPETVELVEDYNESFDPENFGWDADLPRSPIKTGVDVIQADPEDVSHLPHQYRKDIMEYSTHDNANVLIEGNGNPGSMADLVARWSGNPEQIVTLHVLDAMYEMAGIEGYDPEDAAGDPGSNVWSRMDEFYVDMDRRFSEIHNLVR